MAERVGSFTLIVYFVCMYYGLCLTTAESRAKVRPI